MGTQETATTHTHNAGNDTEHIHYISVVDVVTKKGYLSSTKALKILNKYHAKCGTVIQWRTQLQGSLFSKRV